MSASAAHAPLRAAVLSAAHELGIVSASTAPVAVADLAVRTSCDPLLLERLVDVLVMESMLARDGDGRVRAVGVPAPGARGGRAIAEVVRRGRRIDGADTASLQIDAKHVEAQRIVHDTPETIHEVAKLVGRWVAGKRLLDAGGGFGAYSLEVIDVANVAHALVIELPAVVEAARAQLRGLFARVSWRAGDLRACELGEHDVILVNNVVHMTSPRDADLILGRLSRALVPDGWLVVKELRIAADRSGGVSGLYFALVSALAGIAVALDTVPQLQARLARAGLDVEEVGLATDPDAVVLVGRRR